MAIVVDAARENYIAPAVSMRYMQTYVSVPETHINSVSGEPTNNTLDAWVPIVATGSDADAPT